MSQHKYLADWFHVLFPYSENRDQQILYTNRRGVGFILITIVMMNWWFFA